MSGGDQDPFHALHDNRRRAGALPTSGRSALASAFRSVRNPDDRRSERRTNPTIGPRDGGPIVGGSTERGEERPGRGPGAGRPPWSALPDSGGGVLGVGGGGLLGVGACVDHAHQQRLPRGQRPGPAQPAAPIHARAAFSTTMATASWSSPKTRAPRPGTSTASARGRGFGVDRSDATRRPVSCARSSSTGGSGRRRIEKRTVKGAVDSHAGEPSPSSTGCRHAGSHGASGIGGHVRALARPLGDHVRRTCALELRTPGRRPPPACRRPRTPRGWP